MRWRWGERLRSGGATAPLVAPRRHCASARRGARSRRAVGVRELMTGNRARR